MAPDPCLCPCLPPPALCKWGDDSELACWLWAGAWDSAVESVKCGAHGHLLTEVRVLGSA